MTELHSQETICDANEWYGPPRTPFGVDLDVLPPQVQNLGSREDMGFHLRFCSKFDADFENSSTMRVSKYIFTFLKMKIDARNRFLARF